MTREHGGGQYGRVVAQVTYANEEPIEDPVPERCKVAERPPAPPDMRDKVIAFYQTVGYVVIVAHCHAEHAGQAHKENILGVE